MWGHFLGEPPGEQFLSLAHQADRSVLSDQVRSRGFGEHEDQGRVPVERSLLTIILEVICQAAEESG